jgi:spermidine synthase
MISKVSPQGINAMKKDIDEAKGKVLVIGLGLGYFPYMVSLKDDVNHIDVIEEDINVINIFNKVLFKQFQNKNKINILEGNIKSSQLELDKYDYIYVNSYNNFSQAIDVYNLFNENDKYKKLKNIHFYLLKSIKLLK